MKLKNSVPDYMINARKLMAKCPKSYLLWSIFSVCLLFSCCYGYSDVLVEHDFNSC